VDGGIPAEANASANEDAGAEGVGAVDVDDRREAELLWRVKVHHALHRGAVEDAEALLLWVPVRLFGGAVGDGQVVYEDAVALRVLVVPCSRAPPSHFLAHSTTLCRSQQPHDAITLRRSAAQSMCGPLSHAVLDHHRACAVLAGRRAIQGPVRCEV